MGKLLTQRPLEESTIELDNPQPYSEPFESYQQSVAILLYELVDLCSAYEARGGDGELLAGIIRKILSHAENELDEILRTKERAQ